MRKVFSPKLNRGQSLFELAITLPLLLMILGIILDFGRLYFTYVALEDAVQEGAIYYMLNTNCPYDPPRSPSSQCFAPYNASWRMRNSTGGQEVDWSRVDPTTDVQFSTTGSIITARVTYDYDILLPFVSGLFEGGSFPITVESQIQDITSGS